MYDVKAIDEDVHIKCTGISNKVILDNLRYLDSKGCAFEVRIPFVPGYNSEEICKIAEFLKDMKNLTKVRVLPYHNFAGSKYAALDMENTLPEIIPTEDEIQNALNILNRHGIKTMK